MTIQIYVGNLPFTAREDDVYDLFTPFGDIISLNMINDPDTGRFRGFCYVEMDNADAQAAIEALDGTDYNGRALRVNEVRPRGGSNSATVAGHRGGGGYAGNRGDDSGEDGDDWDDWDDWDEDGENWEEDEGDDDEEGEWADPDYPN